MELLIGGVCALISILTAALIIYLAYLVFWKNPRELGVHNESDAATLVIFSILVVIAVGFSSLSLRLLSTKQQGSTLLSPVVLQIWGVFFIAGSLVVFIAYLAKGDWSAAGRQWELLLVSIAMAIAAFALAKKQRQKIKDAAQIEKPPRHFPDSKNDDQIKTP